MAKQYKVLVNTGKADNNKVLDIQQGVGDRGQPVRIKAQAGAKYELQEAGRKKPVGPDYIKAKRVGKDLHILFEDERQASLIIEDYYEVMPEGYNGVIGQAESGSFYEYIPEDPKVSGLVSELAEGGQAVNVALGGAQVAPVGVALGGFAFSPLMGILGLGAIGAVAAAVDGKGNKTPNTGVAAGKLDSGSDSGVVGDQKTNNASPTLSGTVPSGATAAVTIHGQKYAVTVNPDGTWSFNTPTNLPDGTYYPILHVTQNGVTQDTNITPFTIDTTAPTIAISSNAVALAANQTATITFTLSEASSDFTAADITVTGGSLGSLTQSATDPKVYTALFTPAGSGTSASISLGNGRFSDAAANLNADGAEANNTVSIATNASTTGELSKTSPNDSGVPGDNITNNTKPSLNGKVPAGSTASVTLNGQKYPVTVNPDGAWSFTNPTNLPDGTYTPVLDVTTNGQTSSTPLTPFTIDTTPPTITVTSAASVLAAGQSTSVTFTLSEAANDFAQEDITVTGGTLSNFQKSATDPKVYTATFTPSGTGSSATISVASAKFSDAAANRNADGAEANNTVSLSTNNATSGQLAPASDNSTGTPNDGKTNDKTPELSGKVPAGSTASVTLNGQTYPVTVKPDGTWSFTQPTDLPDGTYTPQLNVITNGQSSTTPITPFTIDTTPPTVAITGGASTLVAGQSTTLTLTLSEASTDLTDADLVVAGGKLGPLQQSASNPLVYTATFTAGSGSNASVSIGSDKFADAVGNLNKDGAETNNSWTTAVTPSTSASAKTALSIDPIAGDNIVNTTDGTGSYNVTGKVTGIYATGDLVEFALNGKTYAATVAADGSFSVPVSMADLKADADSKIEGTITGKDGDTATASQDYQVENSANANTLTALSIDPVTDDNLLSDTEVTDSIAITGNVTGKFATGDTVTLNVNGKTFTGSAAATGKFSINVPAEDLQADADTQIDGTVTGTGGTTAAALQNYALDSDGPFTSSAGTGAKTELTIDPIGGDNIVTASEGTGSYNVTGKVTGTYTAGDTVTLTVNGKTFTGTAAANGSYSIAVPASDLTADSDTQVDGTVTGTGGTTAKALQDYGVDTSNTSSPTATGDTTSPTIIVERTNPATATLDANGKETITFKLSEASTTLDANDIAVTGGTLSNFIPVPTSGTAATGYTQYTAVFTPTAGASGTGTIGVASGKFADNAGNLNPDTYVNPAPNGATAESNNQVSVAYDTRSANPVDNDKPTVQVSIDKTSLSAGQSATLSFILSEASVDFSAADIDVISGGGTISNLQPVAGSNGVQFTATYTAGNTAGTVQIGVGAGKFADAAGNTNADTYQGSATGTSAVSNTTAEANNWVSLTNTGSSDTTAPTVAVTRAGSGTVSSTGETIVFTFSEGVATSSFVSADIDVTGGNISNLTPVESSKTATGVYTQYTATYNPTTNSTGTGTISVAAGKFADAAGNNNLDTYSDSADTVTGRVVEANNQVVLSYNTSTNPVTPDTTAPVIAISADKTTLSAGQTATISFTLSETSTDFTAADVAVTGGTLSNFAGSGTSYTATFTPSSGSQGVGSVHVTSNAFRDAASNYNQDGADANNTVNFVTNSGNDATAPTMAISSNQASLAAGQTATITFTLSEASSNFVWDGSSGDVTVSGGTLSAITQDSTNPLVYTATFTPTANSTADGVISVASNQFTDAANNANTDGAEANNTVTLTVNTISSTSNFTVTNDTHTVNEDGAAINGNVMTNDSLATRISKIALAGGTDSSISAGTTSSTGTTVAGNFGSLKLGADGTYAYTIDNTKASVQALKAGDKVSEVFTYTATDGSDFKTANLTITITGTNDAPVAVADTASATEAGGAANATAGTNPTGNVLSNDTDVDTADTKTVSAIHAGNATGTTGDSAVSAGTATSKVGSFGSISINADGSYTYTVDNANASVQALLPSSTALTDTFTYTVKDAAGATSQQTITVSIQGANDAPQVQVALVDQNATTGSALSYTFAGNAGSATDTFKDVDTGHPTGLTYTATLTDGSSLPSWLSFNATTRTFSGTPPTGTTGPITVKVTASDALGLSASDDFAINLTAAPSGDTTPPTILVERTNPASTLDAVGTETILFKLSEASTTFDASDIAVTGGTLGNFTPVASSGTAAGGYTQYTAVFTPTAGANGTATIGVASAKFADMAGNINQDTYLSPAPTGAVTELATGNTNLVSVVYDTRSTNPADNDKPTVLVSIDKATLSSGQTATLTFILSESSTNFALADIDVISGGGTVSNLLPVAGSNGVQYTATYTAGSTAGTVLIGVDSAKFSDATGNANADTYKGSAAGTTAVANTTAEINNWVSLNNTGASDTTAPTVLVTRTGTGTVGASGETIVFTLSEASTDFVVGDVAATGGALSNWVQISPTQYSATFVPTAGSNGTATIGVLAGKFADAASNLNKDTFTNPATGTDVFEANNQVVLSYDARTNPAPADTTAPTIAITADKTTLAAGQTASITFTLSEASSDFTNADIVVTGGTLSNITGSGTSYTATFTPTSVSQGTGSIRVDSNTFRDAASNYNQDGADANNTVNFITNNGVAPADTTAPTIAIVSNQASLSSGQTALITFTLSETSSDFVWDGTTGDIVVTGGTLSALAAVAGSNGTQYSATFTPAANSTVAATIGVKAGKFTDAAQNPNKDTYDSADTFPGKVVEANNQVSINVNTTGASTLNLVNDTATAIEAGVAVNAGTMSTVAGTNPSTNTQAAGVLGNDTSATSVTAIAFGSNTGTVGNALAGQYGSLTLSSNGTYSYTLNNSNATVNALPAGGTLSEVFTYTATDGTTSKTANLTITITGTNDAPVAVADTATATEAGGAANAAAGTDPTGNVLTNDTDVDTADTKTVSAILAGTTGTASNVTAASAAADTTGIAGSFGTLKIGTDGSYSYAVNQTNASVQALLPTSTALTDTFTYTVKDAAGATHTNTLTVSVKGANDAPEVQVALVNQSATPDSLLTYPFAGNTGTASDTFKDVDTGHQTGLTYTATLADGSSLPSWLSFNASTRTFSGTPPESAASTTVAVKVTATDALNASTSSNFNIAIGAVPVASVKTALSIDPIATDNVITSSENTGNIAVTGKVTGTFASGDTVTLSINGKTFTGAAAANGTYSINVPASDLAADSDTKIEGSVTGGNGGTLATAAQDYTVEASTTLTKTALSINPVTPDNLISNSEPDSNGDIAVTGKVTGKFATGDVVTLSVNGVRYSGTAAADGSYSINVKATDLALDADTTIDGTVTGTGGTLATALQNYGLDTSDTTAPTIAISSNQASLATGQTATITFTLSEPSADFDGTDIETSGGSLGALNHVGVNSSGQDIYTATFTPTDNSTANGVVKVASDKFKDAAGNFNKDTYASGVSGTTQETDNTVTLTVNTTNSNSTTPAGVKTALSIDPVTGDNVVISTDTANVTITGKASGTFAEGDTVTLTLNNNAYTGQVAADGSYSISVTASDLTADSDTKIEGTITGTGGDTATAAQDYTVESNSTLTKTALTIDRVTADNTVLASEADSNGNIAITGRVSGKFANGDTVSLVVNGVTSTGNVNSQGFYSINVKATDLLADSDTTIDGSVTGTGGTAATAVQNYALTDLAPPTVAISRAGTGAMTAAETITFTLSEASTTFASTDVDISGGALSTLATTDNITYTATFTPTSGFFGSGAIGVKAGTFTDASSNANKDTYEAFVTGTILEENNLLDLSINTDTTPPTVIVSRSTSTTVTGAETITFTLSDNAGTSFDASDIFVTPGAGTLSNFVGDGTVYTATFTPTANSAGSATIGVMAGKFRDPAGNLNKDTFDSADSASGKVVETDNAVTFNYKTDNTTPTIAITGPAGAVSGPTTITFTLSEVSSDFVWDPSNPSASTNDIVVTGGGTLSALTPSTTTPGVFTATYTPPSGSGTGTATISVASNKFSDAAGNFNTDGGDTNNSLSVNFDTVTPTVTVSRATTATLGGTGSTAATETITFTLSEASSDFTSSDVVVSAGTLSDLTAVSSTVYTATYTPPTGANAATGTATIGVRAGKFQDAAGNQNADDFTLTGGANSNAENNNNVVSVAYDTVVPTQTVSFSSMTKDSGLSTGNANWTTADASAGRLVSGFVSAPLAAGETVQIWVKKDSGAAALLGTATVDAGGTTWAYTDTTNYVGATGATSNTAGWTYSAKVVDAAGNAALTASQVVNGDYTEAAPIITAARDTASTPVLVGNDPAATASNPTSTTNAIGSVSGTGVAGNTIYLYDNTATNLVGSATVAGDGTWTVSGLSVGTGSNTFSAKQVDPLGNSSVLSNLWTVSTTGNTNALTNGDFASGNTGFTNQLTRAAGPISGATDQYDVVAFSSLGSTGYANTGSTVTNTTSPTTAYTFGTWSKVYRGESQASYTGAASGNPDGAMTGNVLVGQVSSPTAKTIWSQNVAVEAGKSYTFTFDYANFDFQGTEMGVTIDGVYIQMVSNDHEAGHFTATYTAPTTKTMTLSLSGSQGGTGLNSFHGDFVLDNFKFVPSNPAADNSLVAGATPPATANADAALAYAGGTLDALSGNDTITATSSNLQSTLAAGGFIDGGAGIDTLKLAAGTTLNLQTLTGNQTVQKIQEVEILQMQGSSSLTLNANNVLSLGGSNASTMAPFSFSSTQQVADGGVAATGSTSSTGKVQMVIQGGTGDALKLDALATDGISSTAGVLGNSGLTGSWAYKGQVQIGTITYKVYDHSTSQAQVLVDVPVVVTTASPIAITAISSDSGTSSTDFITNDTTLVYSGTVPVEYNDGNHDVFVEILNSSGTVVQSGTASVTNGSWSLDKTGSALTAGNYTIRSTIVNEGTTTTTSSFGSQGVDTQPLVIDTTAPTIIVARANNSTSTLSTGQTETITFTLSEASTNFDVSDVTVTGGTLSNFGGSGTSYTATFTPTASTSGTGSISVANSKFSDAAGNQNADGAEANNTASVPYVTAVPTQTATFSSMTKDSSRALDNADWTTADGSAGRLVSGTLDAVLITGQVLKVYSNGTYIGDAVVSGKAWEITDTTGYTAGWTYTAKVQDTAGNTGPTTTRIVNTDFTEAAPVITSVVDAANASIANAGTTSNALSSVSGTGVAGDTIYLYDNTSTNLVGSTVVGANGTWTVSGLDVGAGSNTFSAKQVDALGNESVLSNLWTVSTAGTNLIANGDFASATAFNSGFGTKLTGADYLANTSNYAVQDTSAWLSLVNTTSSTNPASYTGGTWSKSFVNSTGRLATMTGNMLVGNMVGSGTTWSNTVSVVAGKTYQFSFDYNVNFNTDSGSTSTKGLRVFVDGVAIDVVNTGIETGRFVATYTATTTRAINLSTFSDNTRSISPNNAGDYVLDNFTFAQTPPASDNSLVAGSAAPGTSGNDTALTFSAGSIDAQAGNDTITSTSTALQATLAAGGFIDGGAGADTLKLAAGTTLDLTALTNNQTVQSIQQIEIFELQGNGSLTLSANDVLSLGGANASTMSAYSFTSTSGGSASANSTGKVQMVITGTSSDALKLKTLAQDGVTTNGLQGNTGLGGEWLDMGTTTIGSTSYRVYNHSTTQAQVLTTLTASTESATVAFTSMTKDSGLTGTGANTDWRTADGTAGRLVSGTLAEPLPAGGSVKIYANGTLLGNATVNTAGTAWEFTDTVARSANWTYRADVVTSSGTIASAVQQVYLVADPAITNVVVDTYTTSATTENFSSYTAGSTVGPNFTITGRNGGIAGYGGSGATFNKVNDLLGGGMAIQFGNPQNQNAAALGEILITKKTGDMYSISFLYGDLQFGAKTVKLYAADGTVVNTFSIANGGGTFSSGIQTRAFTSIGISGGKQDFWIMDNFNFAVASATTGGQVNLAANSTFLDTTPVLQGTTGRALTAGETIHIFDGATDLGAATVTGTNWTFNTTMAAGSTKTYTASIVSASGQVLQTSNGFTATQSPSSSLAPTGNLPTAVSDTVTYSGSSIDALGGNDTITATSTTLQATLAAGGFIDGGAGLDTLKLAAGTTLNLVTLTSNQTVKPIQQVETFELQGTSTLTLSANTVLSLGVTDGFSGSAGKVQLLVKGTSSDSVALQNLLSDGVGGNTGLAGMWSKEASTVTVNSATYNVYTHSTTGAQVLISAAIPDSNVSLSASPLVLDLNGDGVQTLNLDLGTQFDLLNTGAKQSVGWVDKHDGLLVMDLNHDGIVNSGAELMGTSTRLASGALAEDGWAALAQYDANTDGVIDAKDAVFQDLQVWVDANSNGVSEAAELKTLADVGVLRIDLKHDNALTSQNGNLLQGFSSFTTTDGQSHQIVDAWFQTSATAAPTVDLVNAKADILNLNLSDVLKTAANTAGLHVVQVNGDANDTVNLSNLLNTGEAQGSWQASGVVVQTGVTYNAYSHSADASLQVLIDQNITQVNMG